MRLLLCEHVGSQAKRRRDFQAEAAFRIARVFAFHAMVLRSRRTGIQLAECATAVAVKYCVQGVVRRIV